MFDGNAPRPSPRGLEVLWFPLAVSRLSLELTFSMFSNFAVLVVFSYFVFSLFNRFLFTLPAICIVILEGDAVLNVVVVHVPAAVTLQIGNWV